MQLDNVKTLRDAVNYGKQFLEDFGIENAQYDATELLLLVMGISRTQYLINSMDKIDSGKQNTQNLLIKGQSIFLYSTLPEL